MLGAVLGAVLDTVVVRPARSMAAESETRKSRANNISFFGRVLVGIVWLILLRVEYWSVAPHSSAPTVESKECHLCHTAIALTALWETGTADEYSALCVKVYVSMAVKVCDAKRYPKRTTICRARASRTRSHSCPHIIETLTPHSTSQYTTVGYSRVQ